MEETTFTIIIQNHLKVNELQFVQYTHCRMNLCDTWIREKTYYLG